MAYRRRRSSGSRPFGETNQKDYSPYAKANILRGMLDYINGGVSEDSALVRFLRGDSDVRLGRSNRAYELGKELGEMLRELAKSGYIDADEFGYYVRDGKAGGFVETQANAMGNALSTATFGAVNLGDEGGIDDILAEVFGD